MNGLCSEQFPAAAAEKQSESGLLCPKCNARSCKYSQSNSKKNPGRYYYSCPASDHKFFKWEDQVKPHELIQVPHCGGCGAGVCRVRRESAAGPNKGRIMFMCTVKEGEGSCGYRVWKDELEKAKAGEMMDLSKSGTVKCCNTNLTVTDMDEESKLRDEGMDLVSPLMEPPDDVIISEVKIREMDQFQCVEGKSRTTSRRPSKRSRYGEIIATYFPISASFSTVWPDLDFMSSTDCWMVDAFCQNLSSELNGWWGRLVFRPTRSLMARESKPATSSVSYPLESTSVVLDTMVNRLSITGSRNSKGDERYIELFFYVEHDSPIDISSGASISRRSLLGAESDNKPKTQTTISKSISDVFHRAAECLQDELRTRLEAMDAKDHEAMSQEAEVTFAALDHLRFDYKDFKKRVKELIRSASQLAEINRAMPTDDSFQRLVELCSSERKRLDKINCVHAEAVEAEIKNKKFIQHMQEKISSAKDWLFQIEVEVSCCEAEMRSLELELEEISKSKAELEGKYVIASKEVEESHKLVEQKEAEQNAAKAKFNKARALLKG